MAQNYVIHIRELHKAISGDIGLTVLGKVE